MLIPSHRWSRILTALLGFALLTVHTARAQKSDPDKSTTNSGTISGRVVTQTGEAVSGATAVAVPIGIQAQGRSAAVDRSGSFKFEGLDGGVYFISASLPGFTAPIPSPDEPRRYTHPGETVDLTLIKGGVITGTVTSGTNDPIVATPVRAYRIKDVSGQREPIAVQPRERQTDDRGMYRFYGLTPGIYLISAGGPGRAFNGLPGAYDSDVPVFAPSSTRDTAMEVLVNSGEEVVADIQYHSEPGHAVSGSLAGLIQATGNLLSVSTGTISLTDVRTHSVVMSAGASNLTNNAFAFYGIANGEYEVVAQQFLPSRDTLYSEPRRVIVQGADITGIALTLAPLASVSGYVVVESNPPVDCVKRNASPLVETVINANRFSPEIKAAGAKAGKPEPLPTVPIIGANPLTISIVDTKGDFLLRNLQRGSYRISAQLPGTGWYLRSISMGAANSSQANVARDGVTLKPGERVSRMTITMTAGAAGLRGRVSVAEGQTAPANLRIYLVPAEHEAAENVLRFFAAAPDTRGAFAIDHIAPGRYWIMARVADDGDPVKAQPFRFDPGFRAKVLKEAEALKKEVSFKPCEQSADFNLPWAP